MLLKGKENYQICFIAPNQSELQYFILVQHINRWPYIACFVKYISIHCRNEFSSVVQYIS